MTPRSRRQAETAITAALEAVPTYFTRIAGRLRGGEWPRVSYPRNALSPDVQELMGAALSRPTAATLPSATGEEALETAPCLTKPPGWSVCLNGRPTGGGQVAGGLASVSRHPAARRQL